jgi:hypothetical protein
MKRSGGARSLMLAVLVGAAGYGQPVAFCADDSALPTGGIYEAEGRRDPFIALVRDGRVITPPQGAGDGKRTAALPMLRGILWDAGGRSIALIDDTELQVGGETRGYRVTAITKAAVTLTRGEKSFVLRLEESGAAPSTTLQPGGGDLP